jgi:hypothetical protein
MTDPNTPGQPFDPFQGTGGDPAPGGFQGTSGPSSGSYRFGENPFGPPAPAPTANQGFGAKVLLSGNDPSVGDMLGASLLGGTAAGLLSGAPFFSCCCCLWAMFGGSIAVWRYLGTHRDRGLRSGAAALLGALSGVVAAAWATGIWWALMGMLNTVLEAVMTALPPEVEESVFDALSRSGAFEGITVAGFVGRAGIFALLGALGAVISLHLVHDERRIDH